MIHGGPSSIGIETIFKSKGEIPHAFLRGCGVSEDVLETLLPMIRSGPPIQWHSSFISYSGKDEEFARRLHSRMREAIRNGPPIQWHSCFISYSGKDEEFARRLHSRMHESNMRVWFAREDVQGGRKLHEQLFEAIQIHDKLLLVLSNSSMQSEWVMTEIRKAREVERNENRRKLFPIRLCTYDELRSWTCFDADSGKDLAVELREYFIPDFSNWKDHDTFEGEFEKLRRDLKADQKPKGTA